MNDLLELYLESGGNSIDFWESDFEEVNDRIRGYNLRLERQRKEAWEIARWQTASLITAMGFLASKKNKPVGPKDLIVFPWEEEGEKVEITQEQAKEVFTNWDKIPVNG